MSRGRAFKLAAGRGVRVRTGTGSGFCAGNRTQKPALNTRGDTGKSAALAALLTLGFSTVVCAAGHRAEAAEAVASGGGTAEVPEPAAHTDDQRRRSELHYRSGLELFEAGDRAQALVEFELAYELFGSDDIIFMMAQCEYHLGQLAKARAHYTHFLNRNPEGRLAETARVRLIAIERRPGTLVINSVPDKLRVTIEGPNQTLTGQAPNRFEVRRGRYTIRVERNNYQPQQRLIDIDAGETKSLFFGLEPVPARLSIRTTPSRAALFVRGMRAENPYDQDVAPGAYQVYAEAEGHQARRETFLIKPGQRRSIAFTLDKIPRSGRPELVTFWSLAGAAMASGGVLSLLEPDDISRPNPASSSVILAAGGAGAVAGLLVSNAFTADYVQDNHALFRIGASWAGAVEGALIGLALDPQPHAAWIGGVAGLGVGAATGYLFDKSAPSYGRLAAVQSAALFGLFGGMLATPAFAMDKEALPLMLLGGLNVGLGAGLVMAYAFDDSLAAQKSSPAQKPLSWRRVLLVDLAGVAGAFTGAVASTVASCRGSSCRFESTPTTAGLALGGAALGLVAGWYLTRPDLPGRPRPRSVEAAGPSASTAAPGPLRAGDLLTEFVQSLSPSVIPVQRADGRFAWLPGLQAFAVF